MHRVDIKNIQWPARKLSIGDALDNRIVYQVGTEYSIPGGRSKISSITEDKENNSYLVCVQSLDDSEEELPWKVIKDPSKTVEIEYDLSHKAYPKEA